MAKHLTGRDVEKIAELLDGWSGKLSWDLLCNACEVVMGSRPARQTLFKFVRIKSAFDARKAQLKEGPKIVLAPPSLRAAADRIARLDTENERLRRENAALLQQFVVWQYNAYARGLSERDLNAALPTINRSRTD